MRVLAVAGGEHASAALPDTPHGFRLEWAGLIGLADPLRTEVPKAIAECREAGIRVVMITGDYPTTAPGSRAIGGTRGRCRPGRPGSRRACRTMTWLEG